MTTHDHILTLRRSHSLREVAKITGVPLGTVKAICSRSGVFRDNPDHRALFSLPAPLPSDCTGLAVAELPPQRTVTGDKELDALLWLRDVIATGHPGHIERAMQAAERIKTPLKELEKRYSKFLDAANPGHFFATFGAFGLADLQAQAKKATQRAATKARALAIFGNERDLFESLPAELFCVDALRGVKADRMGFLEKEQTAKRFDAKQAQRPHTLADCLHELAFWDELYTLRAGFFPGDPLPEVSAREDYVFGLMATIRPRGSEEAVAVLRCLADRDRMEREETTAILENLIT